MSSFKFKTPLAENIFHAKYSWGAQDTWPNLVRRLVDDVCGTMGGKLSPVMAKTDRDYLEEVITEMKFIPGGRYLYYAGRPLHNWNNCFLLRGEEDTREEWAELMKRVTLCLMYGGGIGVDYSVFRPSGRRLDRTGGLSSGPLPLIHAVNELGRSVIQGGSRRSAIYGSLNWRHGDIEQFLELKNWDRQPIGTAMLNGQPYTNWHVKQDNFNHPAPLDMTNISVNYDDEWLTLKNRAKDPTFLKNVEQALRTGEPGFSFNFGPKQSETLRNACCEITSSDDSDVCNLGSINIGNISSINEFRDIVHVASKFLVCGTMRADLPYEKVYKVREKNRRLGLGLMGIHSWLLQRGKPYMVDDELHSWLDVYETESTKAANSHCDRFYLSRPKGYRAIAPTGTIGILASTTTGIEPLFAVAYKRRYLLDAKKWHYEYVVDATAQQLINEYGLNPSSIETAYKLTTNPEKRIAFQADVQNYVDHAISSTINLPKFTEDSDVAKFAETLSEYAPRLRGFTCYPDGSRGGQPLEEVDYADAIKQKGVVFLDNDPCKDGICGL